MGTHSSTSCTHYNKYPVVVPRSNMKLCVAVSVLLLGVVLAKPQTSNDDKGLRETAKDAVKDVLGNVVTTNINSAATCLPPFYYCHTTSLLISHCRYSGLTWFLMIGLPLILIGIAGGVWYYKRHRSAA